MGAAAIRENFERQRSAGTRAGMLSLNAFISTITDYKADGTGAGLVWVSAPHADDPNQTLGPMPIMVTWAGSNFGSLAGPAKGTPVIVLNLAPDNDDYVAIGFLHSNVRPAPKVPSGEDWRVHPHGGVVKLTNDGPVQGDAAGGTQIGGATQHETFTKAGHSDVFNDVAQTIVRKTVLGHSDTFSDLAQTVIRKTAAGSQHIMDDVHAEMSSVSTNVTLGARLSSMSAVNSAINKSHLSTYETNRQGSNLTDLIANAVLDHAVGIISSGQLTAKLASLVAGFTVATTLPLGSTCVKFIS